MSVKKHHSRKNSKGGIEKKNMVPTKDHASNRQKLAPTLTLREERKRVTGALTSGRKKK